MHFVNRASPRRFPRMIVAGLYSGDVTQSCIKVGFVNQPQIGRGADHFIEKARLILINMPRYPTANVWRDISYQLVSVLIRYISSALLSEIRFETSCRSADFSSRWDLLDKMRRVSVVTGRQSRAGINKVSRCTPVLMAFEKFKRWSAAKSVGRQPFSPPPPSPICESYNGIWKISLIPSAPPIPERVRSDAPFRCCRSDLLSLNRATLFKTCKC